MEIVNKVANSGLLTFDLESIYPKNQRVFLDISPFLKEGFILIEKDFRTQLKEINWKDYQDQYVALGCSTEALLPSWTYLLMTTYLQPYAKYCTVGSLQDLEREIFIQLIENINFSEYHHKKVLIKGCSHKTIPVSAFTQLVLKLQPMVKSLMYGEACSSVPLYKEIKKNS